MRSYYGLLETNSDKTSTEYIEVNNFGYYEELSHIMNLRRYNGRSDYHIFLLQNGKGTVHINGEKIRINSGDAVLFRPGEPQCYDIIPGENTNYYWIHFTGIGVPELLEKLGFDGVIYKNISSAHFVRCIRKMSELAHLKSYRAATQRAGALLTMLAETAEDESNVYSGIFPVLTHMAENPGAKLTNFEYAEMCKMSTSHFMRKFKEYTGMAPKSYKTDMLVKKAAHLLQSTQMNISQISYELGFDDSLYFSRIFKKRFGVSPLNYRKSNREKE